MFDDTIQALRKWFEQKDREKCARKFYLSTDSDSYLTSPAETRENSASTIILREDTHVELGHPSAGSCSLCAATSNHSLIRNGALTLVGPDIPEVAEKLLPFAQIVIASCKGDAGAISLAMDNIVHTASQGEGYMLRSVPNRVWARVSKDAARSGFSLKGLGARLHSALLAEISDITGIEIFFVTSSRVDVLALEQLVQPALEKLGKLQTYERLPDGTYQCTTGLDCTECSEKTVCDNIREVITIRKGDRLITFERNNKMKPA
jgi:hypothetical protein